MPAVDITGLERLVTSAEAATPEALEQFVKLFPRELAKVRRQAGMQPVRVNGSRQRGLAAGYFQMRLRDGTTGFFQRRVDDCIPAVIASLLQMPPHLVPDLRFDELRAAGTDPDEIERINDEKFARWVDKYGLTIVFHATPPRSARRWIGVVQADDEGWNDHTLLMSGRECLFDPAHLLPPGAGQPTALPGYGVDGIGYGITIERR